MAISRSLMNRQLRADGGIMQVAPREKFGLGSKLKKFVRKIIPNEVADIAVKAAPFVAPFNPAVAAAMSGLGTFDQTGSIGKSLKGAGMNYAGGQAARYLGGAGFQDPSLSAFTPSGFKAGFSSPLGNETGLGKFFSNRGTEGVQGIDMATGGADGVGVIQDAPTKALASELSYVPEASIDMVTGGADGVGIIQDSFINKTTVAKEPGFLKNLFDGVSNQDYGKIGNTIKDGAKKFGKAMFTNKDGSIDKAAVMGAITFATSYAEALALANDAGIELTEEDYNQAQADEKKAEYAGYLTNFFGGVKDGGRIGFESGANEMIKTQLLEEIMPEQDGEEMITIMTEDGPIQVKKSVYESMPQMFMDTTTSAYGDAGRGRPVPEFAKGGRIGFKKGSDPVYEMYLEDLEAGIIPSDKSYNEYLDDIEDDPDYDYSYAKGGRVSRKFGSPKEGESEVGIMTIDVEAGDDEDMEDDMMMAGGITFNSAEKSFLFKRLGGAGGSDRSYTMPSLYRILNNPNRYPEDARILKAIVEINLPGGQKDGGRIGFNDGSSTGNFGADRYASELVEAYESLLNKGDLFLTDVEKELLEKGEYPSPDKMKELTTRYENLEKEYEQGENKFDNINLQDSLFDKDALKYYNKKIKDLENREERLMDKEEKINEVMYTDLDVSSILKTPAFQEWYSLWKVKDPKADDLPNAEYFENMMFDTKRLRPDFMKTKYDSEMKAKGGRIGYKGGANRVSELLILRDNLLASGEDVSDIEAEIFQLTGKTFRSVGGISDIPTGKIRKNNAGVVERDYRDEGGFVPVGIKERADDVPAMLSKNEFVMTADAVRGIGNGSVEEGSKKLYNTMKQAEKVGKA